MRVKKDIENSQSGLLARIKILEQHAAAGTIPSGLRIQNVTAKGQNADTLQVEFDDIIHEAERKLLSAVIKNLRSDVAAFPRGDSATRRGH